MNVPANLKYTKDHEWIRVEGEYAIIGVTDYAQSQLGDVVFVEIETEGETLAHEEVFGTIEAVKTVSDMFMPVGGEIIEKNEDIDSAAELVNKDPYGKGWICSVRPSDWMAEVSGFSMAESATAWFRKELERIRDFMAGASARAGNEMTAAYMQDGGEPVDRMLEALTPEEWNRFQKEFLE